MKSIIVAVDYSKNAEAAFRYAALLARFTKSTIALLNIYKYDIHALNGLISPAEMDRLSRQNTAALEKYARELSEEYKIPLEAYTLSSAEDGDLKELAQKLDAGLIVMGMSRNIDKPSLTGIASTTILKNNKIPVLIVPEGVGFRQPDRMLYACDYDTVPNEDCLAQLKDIAQTFAAELQLLHVWETNYFEPDEVISKKKFVREFEDSIGTLKHSYREVSSSDIIKGLEKGIEDYKADILVMSPHKYGFWNSLFHKSKTEQMAHKSTVPLLLLPS